MIFYYVGSLLVPLLIGIPGALLALRALRKKSQDDKKE